ncbi:Hypothetical predicted protein [Pelobates cultripes]|uniref:Uncharacterized protein n=1 Tax=Pelobates cultripes TaxID=61616 RepID=A0AAD1WRD1_PELCU|nr:Hypothetical predicted protein [Pelobates cultripes]
MSLWDDGKEPLCVPVYVVCWLTDISRVAICSTKNWTTYYWIFIGFQVRIVFDEFQSTSKKLENNLWSRRKSYQFLLVDRYLKSRLMQYEELDNVLLDLHRFSANSFKEEKSIFFYREIETLLLDRYLKSRLMQYEELDNVLSDLHRFSVMNIGNQVDNFLLECLPKRGAL